MTSPGRLRLAILHYAAPPTIGGVESTIAAHARLFSAHGYSVKIIAGRGERFDPRIPLQIIPILDSRHSFVESVQQKLAAGSVPRDFDALVLAIKQKLEQAMAEIDLCIAHNVLTLHKNLAFTAALREIARTRHTIAWCHDFAWDDPVYTDEMHEGLPWDLMRQCWENVKYVVVSEARRSELADLLGIKRSEIHVVPPGIDIADFFGLRGSLAGMPTRSKSNIPEEHASQPNWLDAAPLLLVPARVTRRKNIELAIEITAALQERGLEPVLVVMGPLGPHNPANVRYLEELRALRRTLGVENAVVFLQEFGQVSDRTRRDLYWLADAMLFASEREGFGIPILEAGLTRLPIFCSDIPPFRESALEHAHYFGLDESPASIAVMISDVLATDAQYQLKKRVLREYGWEQIFSDRIEPIVNSFA